MNSFKNSNLERCTSTGLKPVTHVIFDLDGLILDTEPIYEQILSEILATHGKILTKEQRFQTLGLTRKSLAEYVIKTYDLQISEDEFSNNFDRISKERLTNTRLLPGVQRLICHFCTQRIPMALATSSADYMGKIKIAPHNKLFALFRHHVYGGSDRCVKRSKPAPDIFLVAASRFIDRPDPANCLVFEDAPNGVEAALAAGMQVVMVPDKRIPSEMCQNATKVLSTLCDFKPEIFGLPPFKCDR